MGSVTTNKKRPDFFRTGQERGGGGVVDWGFTLLKRKDIQLWDFFGSGKIFTSLPMRHPDNVQIFRILTLVWPPPKPQHSPTSPWGLKKEQTLLTILKPSPSKPHLRLGVPVQRPQKDLILHPTVVLHVEYLRQPDLPRRVPLQRHVRAEKDQQVWLAHDAFRNLRIDQVARDVIGR